MYWWYADARICLAYLYDVKGWTKCLVCKTILGGDRAQSISLVSDGCGSCDSVRCGGCEAVNVMG